MSVRREAILLTCTRQLLVDRMWSSSCSSDDQATVTITSGSPATPSEKASCSIEQAIALEQSLTYTEPKDWSLPPRQVLGAVLLDAGRPSEAEKVYREDLIDHPRSGWSLFGLAQSRRAQGKVQELEEVEARFQIAWADADVTLASSRF